MGKSINVVYCVTKNYIEKIKPSIKSLREFNQANIYLVTETDQCDIDGVHVIDIRAQEYFKPNSINYHNFFTYIGLLKVCYQSLLKCDKVIHLDADTIINDSLLDMWTTDLNGKWYGMVEESKGKYKPFGEKYYNAGVMLINLKQLRKDNIQERMVEYLNTVRQPWCEQDAFNKFGLELGKIVDLPVRFNENMMTGTTDHPAIVHYCAISNWWDNRSMPRAEYLSRYR